MKKGLGLQANISGFNTTLPQTKHLNFFMGTNPVGYANGGAVRRGVPSSNMNVTQGFLPMALGFDNGGDVSFYTLVTRVIGNYLAKQSGKSPDDPEIIAAAENLQQTNPEAIRVIMESEYGSGVSAGPYDSGFPIGGEPKLPTETVADDFSSAADATKDIRPDSVTQDQFTGLDSAGVITPSTLGETDTESPPILDYLQDKGKSVVDAITGYFGDDPIRQTGGDASVMEEIMKAREDAPQVKEDDVKKPEEKPVEETPVDVKSATVTDGGIADLNKEEEKELQETIKGATDNKDKKDAPSWALPLMSAGFAMMASKSPNFLQALGEAGQEGIKTLTAQREAKEDKLDRESARKLQEARTEALGRPDTPFRIGNAFYRYDNDNNLVKVKNIQRSLTEIEADLRERIINYDTLSLEERQELVKREQMSDENIMYQSPESTTDQKSDRGLKDVILDYIGY